MRQNLVRSCWVVCLLSCALAQATPPAQWVSRGIGGGGALYSPSFSPFNADEIYLACDMGEIFHTTSRGAAWSTLDFRQLQGWHNTQVQFTSDPNVLYSFTSPGPAYLPAQSSDGGVTWKLTNDPSGGSALWLSANPQRSDQLLLGAPAALYVSSDGGVSFTKFAMPNANTHFGGAFYDGLNIYVGTSQGLYVSADGGQSFALAPVGGIPATEAIVSFAGARQGAITRFFVVTLKSSAVKPDFQGSGNWAYQGVYTLDYGQAAWSAATTGLGSNDRPFFVAMTPGDISVAYLAGGTQVNPRVTAVYRTANGGASWQSVFKNGSNAWSNLGIATGWQGYPGGPGINWWLSGAPALGFAVAPGDSNRVLVSDSGWAHLSTDGGTTWQQVYVDPSTQNATGAITPPGKAYQGVGLEPTATWWLTWLDAGHLIESMSDFVGARSADGGVSWAFDMAGLAPGGNTLVTYQTLVNPATGVIYAATSSDDDIYQSTRLTDTAIDGGKGSIMTSADGGKTWQVLHDFGRPVVWMELDPNHPNHMLASVPNSVTGGIYSTGDLQDGSASIWVALTSPPRTQGHPYNVRILADRTIVATYSGRIDASGKFTDSSGVFASADGGNTWTDLSIPGMHYWTMNLTIEAGDPTQSTWDVGVFTGWGGVPNGAFYRTTDRGATFKKIFGGDTFTSTVNPANPDEMYVATAQRGLWYTSNLTSGAPTFAQTSYPFAHPSRVFFNPYVAGELWVTSLGNGLRVGQ